MRLHAISILLCVAIASPALGFSAGQSIGGGGGIGTGGSAVGSSSDTQVLFNDSGGVTGDTGMTFTAGTNTLNIDHLILADIPGENIAVFNDNGSGITPALVGSSNDIGMFVDSFDDPDELFLVLDDNTTRFIVARFQASGAMTGDFRTCTISGSDELLSVGSDNFCFKENGALQVRGIMQFWKDNGTTTYNVARFNSEIIDNTATTEEFNFKFQQRGNNLSLFERWRAHSAGFMEFYPGDGDPGLALFVDKEGTNNNNTVIRPHPLTIGTVTNTASRFSGTYATNDGLENASATASVLTAQMFGTRHIATGTGMVYTLPTGAEGLYGCFVNRGSGTFDINPGGSDAIYLHGTAGKLADGDHITSTTAHASVCLRADSAGDWLTESQLGTWADGVP